MSKTNRNEILAIGLMAILFLLVGFGQSWSLSLSILNMCIISAIMALGINIQWGYAGIFNVGIMGFTALGGLAAVLVSYSPVYEAWRVGGLGMLVSLILLVLTILLVYFLNRTFNKNKYKYWIIGLTYAQKPSRVFRQILVPYCKILKKFLNAYSSFVRPRLFEQCQFFGFPQF